MSPRRAAGFAKWALALLVAPGLVGNAAAQSAIIIDHGYTKLSAIPQQWIEKAKADLHIAYGHTSHGSQLVEGMQKLYTWKGSLYAISGTGGSPALDLRDTPFSGASDLGSPELHRLGDGHAHLPQRPPRRERGHLVLVRAGQRRRAPPTSTST